MNDYTLKLTLLSDAAFGRGDGVAGLVDAEVQHDQFGCPFLGGKAIKGMLVNECADILAALSVEQRQRWEGSAQHLFGQAGSRSKDSALLTIGDAQLPSDLRQLLAYEFGKSNTQLNRAVVLDALTTVRHQTAMDETGVPKDSSLRAIRVIVRQTIFYASLWFQQVPTADDIALLAACVRAFRRAGTSRNRGLGRLKAELLDDSQQAITATHFAHFCQEVLA